MIRFKLFIHKLKKNLQKIELPSDAAPYEIKPVKEAIKQILNLQNKDIALSSIIRQMKAIPAEIADTESRIKKICDSLEKSKTELAEMEKSRAQMRAERRAIEAKSEKYKSQLTGMKRKEDYDAIEAEIAKMHAVSGEMEERELELLFEIDAKREKISKDETDTEIAIVKLKGEIDSARASLSDLDIALASAQELYNTAQKNVESEIWLEAYLTLKRNKKPLPLIVKLDKGQCCGCFLKVSGDTADNVANSDSPIYCEHCGKILYIDTRPSG